METKGRELLIFLSVKYKGDWDKIYEAISKKEDIDSDQIINVINNLHFKAITILDEEYPVTLKSIYKPPFVLFCEGDISLMNDYSKNIAVIGSRNPSKYGEESLTNIVKEISKDFVIVSGCALGIDALGQKCCLDNGGKVIGVLGSGIDTNLPITNAYLIEMIRKKGLIISEYPEGVKAKPENYPIRNRIIVGLSKSVFAFDIRKHSGSQCTASLACQYDRNLLSVPYPISEEYKEFINNTFIKEGCYLIENGDDVRFLMSNF